MNQVDLIAAVAEHASLTNAGKAVEALVGTITEALKRGDEVRIAGFGTFETRERAARTGRNPQTGEEIQIAASTSPAFKAAAALKKQVSGS